MIKISDALISVLESNPLLSFGLRNRLFNMAQLAHFLQPLIVARAKKEVQISAIQMQLSRWQQRREKIRLKQGDFQIENLSIYSDLASYSYEKSLELDAQLNKLYRAVSEKNGHIAITRGTHEITVIIEQSYLQLLEKHISIVPKSMNRDLAFVGIRFAEHYVQAPGMLHMLIQQITAQNINIIEIASTYTELNIYIEQKDVQLAFDTLYGTFMLKKKG